MVMKLTSKILLVCIPKTEENEIEPRTQLRTSNWLTIARVVVVTEQRNAVIITQHFKHRQRFQMNTSQRLMKR